MILPNVITRFTAFLAPPNDGGCRLWTGSTVRSGYGKFWFDGKSVLAHRMAFAIANGRWPKGVARHRCDTRLCCEASHLVEGSHRDNARDCIERGRRRPPEDYRPHTIHRGAAHYSRINPERVLRGERVGTSKLTADQVSEIRDARSRGVRLKRLAALYGVTESNISLIAKGKSWADKSLASGSR